MIQKRRVTHVLAVLGLGTFVSMASAAETPAVQIFAAGSLRGVVTDLAAQAGPALGVEVKSISAVPGPCASALEKGESADF